MVGVALFLLAVTAGGALAVGVASSGEGWGQVGDTPVPGDYDGNGVDDVAVVSATGEWYVKDQPPYPRSWGRLWRHRRPRGLRRRRLG